MKINKVFKNILNVILNIFSGWLCFWIFVYALFLITDRKDAEAESFVPLGYCMLFISILVFIVPKIVLFIIKENKKDYFIYNVLPMLIAILIMVLWTVKIEMGYY